MLKSVLASLLLISFIATAVFSIFLMSDALGHGKCPASTARGVECPDEDNTITSLAFHLTTFKSFSTAVFGQLIDAFVLLIVGSLLILGAIIWSSVDLSITLLIRGNRFKSPELINFRRQQALTNWLSLLENSPSSL